MEIYVVDTHALAWFLARNPSLSKRAAETLRRAEKAEIEILIPTIVLAELLYISERKKTLVEIAEVLRQVSSGGSFRIVPFDFPIFDKMKRLPRNLEIHDRIIAATADFYGATVITRDTQIKQIVKTIW